MTQFVLAYGNDRIPYRVEYSDTQTNSVSIHVDPDGSVIVDAPSGLGEKSIRNAVQRRAKWVVRHVNDSSQRLAYVRPKEYLSGEQVLYLGRRYMLKVILVTNKPAATRLIGNRLEVQSRTGEQDDVKGRIRAWYLVKGRDYFARRIDVLSTSLPWVQEAPSFRLLEMSRQWGSCSASGQLILNPHLIKAPRTCIDYVLVHELAHLKHHHHGPEFWRLVDIHSSGWKKAKQRLDSMVEVIFS